MYAELHVKTNFSFLEGASHPDELIRRAAELKYAAIAVTDRSSLAGVVRAHIAAKETGIKLIVGAELTPRDALPVVLWAPDRAAYGRLARLITRGRRRAEKGHCDLCLADVAELADGLLAGVVLDKLGDTSDLSHSKGNSGGQATRATRRDLAVYRDIFGDRAYLLAELHAGPDDQRWAAQLVEWSRRTKLPLLAAGDVHYHVPERGLLHDALVAIRHNGSIAEMTEHLFANHERHLQPIDELRTRFAFAPDVLRRTREIADRCRFSLDELRYEYPHELAPDGQTPIEYLKRLAWEGAKRRYAQGVPDKVLGLLKHELQLIADLHYEAYFLTVWDLVRFARQRGILCQGRGSAANSAVCYCLGITSVDPDCMDLLFERFVSRERNEAPDIDVDFEHERREEVLQYVYEKYGRERAGMTAEVIVYRPRSAVRDLGKALGIAPERIDAIAKSIEHYRHEPNLDQRCREAGVDPSSPPGSHLVELVPLLVGFPRHLSQHTGGMVITHGPLCEMVPIENAAMPDRTVIQWNKDDLDELGILKVDCLCLGMLTAIRKCFDLVQRHAGRRLSLAAVPEGDPQVYAMIRQADTMGVFQIESRAQMSMLPRLRPRSFYDLVIEVAIVRPGPIQGNMVHPYLRRRNGEEPVTYPSEAIRSVLEKTLGVPLFQEQAMRLAVVAAGFTPGEADQLRRAMAAWRRPGLIDAFRLKLIEGMKSNGLSEPYALAVFNQIRGFGEYGFPESHAASFARLVYVSAWLKQHYPAAFAAALLNSQPMGFYAPAQLIRDARRHGVEVRPVDVNASRWQCTLEGPASAALRLGFAMIHGMPQAQAERIVAARERTGFMFQADDALDGRVARAACQPVHSTSRLEGTRADKQPVPPDADKCRMSPFCSMADFTERTGLSRALIVRLAKAGAFKSLWQDRRAALWQALAQEQRAMPLFERLSGEPETRPEALPALSESEEVLADYRTTGLSLQAHPLTFLRDDLNRRGVAPAEALKTLPNGGPVRVAGIVLVRQRPGTAKGITFVTLEDETGQANLIIRPDVWAKYRTAAHGATLLLAHGRLQRHASVIHVLVARIEDYSRHLAGLESVSRDFC